MKESGSGSNQEYKSGSEKRVFSLMDSMPSSNFYDPVTVTLYRLSIGRRFWMIPRGLRKSLQASCSMLATLGG